MRIISQDKTFDVNYNDVALWVVLDFEDKDKYRIQCTYRGEVFDLGIYKNKERAIEVMEKIREQAGMNSIWEMGYADRCVSELKPYHFCYEMPER